MVIPTLYNMRKETPNVMKVDKIHLHSIKTLSAAVKRFDSAFKAFHSNPNTDEYREMETSREDMFLTNAIVFQTSFPESDDMDIKDVIKIAKEIKAMKAATTALNATD